MNIETLNKYIGQDARGGGEINGTYGKIISIEKDKNPIGYNTFYVYIQSEYDNHLYKFDYQDVYIAKQVIEYIPIEDEEDIEDEENLGIKDDIEDDPEIKSKLSKICHNTILELFK